MVVAIEQLELVHRYIYRVGIYCDKCYFRGAVSVSVALTTHGNLTRYCCEYQLTKALLDSATFKMGTWPSTVGFNECCVGEVIYGIIGYGRHCEDHRARLLGDYKKYAAHAAREYWTIREELSALSYLLPQATATVPPPCDCKKRMYNYKLRDSIIHLNDTHKWTREEIADWLDSIDDPFGDGLDLSFNTPRGDGNENY